MRVRSQLILAALLAGGVALCVVAGLVGVTREAEAGLNEQEESQQAARDVASMLSLTNEFVVHGGERAAGQWRSRYDQLQSTLARALQRRTPPSAPLVELRREVGDLPAVFEALATLGREPAAPLAERQRDQLLERLLIETQEVVESRHRWAVDINETQRRAHRRYTVMVLAAPSALLLLVTALALLLGRRVLAPLARLRAAAIAIRRGDLGTRCASDAQDEIGDTARAVDAMAEALQQQADALRASEQRLRLITDNLPALVAHVDAGERYTFVNAYFRTVFGAEPQSLVGKSLREVLGDQARGELGDEIAGVLRGERRSFERHATERGLDMHFLGDYLPDIDDRGKVVGFYVMVMDITARKSAELRQAASEQRLNDLINSLPAMVGYFDMDERYQFANDTALRSQGLQRATFAGMSLRAALGEAAYVQHESHVREVLAGRRSRLDVKIPFEGRAAYFQAHLIPDRVDGGAQRGFYLMTFDITALKEAERSRARVERQLRAVTDNLPVLIAYVDADQRYAFANATFRDWLGIEPAALLGREVAEILGPELYAQRRDALERALAGERVAFDMESNLPGRTRHLHNVYIPDIQPDGRTVGIYALSMDVSVQKEVEAQLSQLARMDPLTGLPNRRQLEERIVEAVARASRARKALAVMFLDVDHFKSINDRLGHAVGDTVLKEFAARLKGAVRVTDTAARLAGDEFVVLLEGLNTGEGDALRVGQKIHAAIRQPFLIDGAPLRVTTSIGIAYCERPGPDTELMHGADLALYDAKEAGRDALRLRTLDPYATSFMPLPEPAALRRGRGDED